jgi:hypothetical protein
MMFLLDTDNFEDFLWECGKRGAWRADGINLVLPEVGRVGVAAERAV